MDTLSHERDTKGVFCHCTPVKWCFVIALVSRLSDSDHNLVGVALELLSFILSTLCTPEARCAAPSLLANEGMYYLHLFT